MKRCINCGQMFDVPKNSPHKICLYCWKKEHDEEQPDIHESAGDRD